MASARSPRRRLAPTVGHEVALDGVHIRAGVLEISGERTVSALVQRIYAMDFINDNAGCFANGGVFPKNGRIIEFGSHRVYFGTVPVRQRLSPVLVAPDPPRWLCAGRRQRRAQRSIIRAIGDTAQAAMNVPPPPSRNIDRQRLSGARRSAKMLESAKTSLIVEKPKYSSPDKTIKAAKAAVDLCDSLTGEALAKQQERVRELLDTVEQQNAEQLAKLNKAIASKSARSTRNAGSKSHGQASSPHPDRRREKEVNAQQMTVYDPVLAGKQQPGNMMPVEKAKGQSEATPEAMPETIMPVDMKPGKTIRLQGQRMMMMRRRCLHQGTGRQGPRHQNVTMKPILQDRQHTGTHWGNAWERDTYRNGMRGTVWIECTCQK
ncbi:hypothetical protein QYE76_044167 [Lolium multiflorum]|uniref:Uncharacterized protein n=1 Tax=Lolium multiflorum TaxID=4521 RepID=A0AAD8TIA6_LOLMU|nr:hypothetical protein QYE76_044167 [Lolium multiflorum]